MVLRPPLPHYAAIIRGSQWARNGAARQGHPRCRCRHRTGSTRWPSLLKLAQVLTHVDRQ